MNIDEHPSWSAAEHADDSDDQCDAAQVGHVDSFLLCYQLQAKCWFNDKQLTL